MPPRNSALGSECARGRRSGSGQSPDGVLARLVAGTVVSPSLSTCVCRLSVEFHRFFTALSVLRGGQLRSSTVA